MLYTIAGVPRSAFERFPMPRNTAVFEPTFRGEGVVRSDDITADPRYGHSAPYHGMPEGHLPVRSLPRRAREGARRRGARRAVLRPRAAGRVRRGRGAARGRGVARSPRWRSRTRACTTPRGASSRQPARLPRARPRRPRAAGEPAAAAAAGDRRARARRPLRAAARAWSAATSTTSSRSRDGDCRRRDRRRPGQGRARGGDDRRRPPHAARGRAPDAEPERRARRSSTRSCWRSRRPSDPRFCSAAFALLEPRRRRRCEVRVASAGHPPALVVRADGEVEECHARRHAARHHRRARARRRRRRARPGDALVLYTDGLIEARSARRHARRGARAASCSPREAGATADELATRLDGARGELQQARRRDDLALLIARVNPLAASSRRFASRPMPSSAAASAPPA